MASSILSSQAVVLATAMAVSGTVILLAFRLQKSFPLDHQIPRPPSQQQQVLRSCISSEGKKKEKKKKKKVHFAEDVMDPREENSEDFRVQLKNPVRIGSNNTPAAKALNSSSKFRKIGGHAAAAAGSEDGRMPANRVALYNGILRDRVIQRSAYSY